MHELRQTFRSLWRDKAFTAMSVVMLALGIGATTAIFSAVNTVVLLSAYPEPDRLFAVEELVPDLADRVGPNSFPVNGGHFEAWRGACDACESLGIARDGVGANLTGDGPPERVRMLLVSHDLLPTLGVSPQFGRGFTPSDDRPGAQRVLLLSEPFWRRRFNADPAVVGQDIRLNGEPRTVIGVLPADFKGLAGDYLSEWSMFTGEFEAVSPLRLDLGGIRGAGNFNYGAVVRLKPGATPEQAADQMNAAIAPFVEQFDREMSVQLRPLDEALVGGAARGLWLLLATVGALLAIVCVNVAALMVVRAERRRREAAVRRALGASAARLAGQAVQEGIALAMIGGAAGLLIANWAIEAITLLAPGDTPRLAQVRLDWTSVRFALGSTVVSGMLAALLPALRFARVPIEGTLRESQASSTSSVARSRSRDLLIAGEVALSAVLLIAAALVGTGLYRLLSVDRGFATENVISFDLTLHPQAYPFRGDSRQRFHDQLLARLEALPGVQEAGFTTKIPLEGSTWLDTITPAEATLPDEERLAAEFRFVSPGYWRAMGVRLIGGRFITPEDRERKVAVISQTAVRKLWPGESAVGKRFKGGPGDDTPWQIVGVVDDVRTIGLDAEPPPIAYLPYSLVQLDAVSYAVRTATDPAALTESIHEAVWAVDEAMPITNLRTMSQVVAKSVARQRFQTMLAAWFAGVALLLASLGIYGVVAYLVARRTNEIGLRMALGAEASGMLRMILIQGLRPAAAGLALGLAGAALLGRFVESLLFGVDSRDPAVFAGVAALLLGSALLACYGPARRAARIDPATALRNQ